MTMESDFGEDGARPSSLIPVHKLATRDPMHDLQLLRDVAIINEQVRRELGPMPKARTALPKRSSEIQEISEMKARSLAAATVVAAIPAHSDRATVVPFDHVQREELVFSKYVGEDKALLALKTAKDEEGGTTAALITRYPKEPAPNRGTFYEDRAGYFCELVLLYDKDGDVKVTGRSRGVVDCENNQANLVADHLELNEQLELTAEKVTFEDEYLLGGSYSTSFVRSGDAWHLSLVSSSRRSSASDPDGVSFLDGIASYPKDFGYISMDSFRRSEVEDALSKNETISR